MSNIEKFIKHEKKRATRKPPDESFLPSEGYSTGEKEPQKGGRFSNTKQGKIDVLLYSELLGETIRVISDNTPFLLASKDNEVIYTESEVRALRGKEPEELKAVHEIKKLFPSSKVIDYG